MPAGRKKQRRRRARRRGRMRSWDRWREQVLAIPEPPQPRDTDGEPRPHFHISALPAYRLYAGEILSGPDDWRGMTGKQLADIGEVLALLAWGKPIPKRLAAYVVQRRVKSSRRTRKPAPVKPESTMLVRAGGDGWTGGTVKRVTESQARRAYLTGREKAERKLKQPHTKLEHVLAKLG